MATVSQLLSTEESLLLYRMHADNLAPPSQGDRKNSEVDNSQVWNRHNTEATNRPEVTAGGAHTSLLRSSLESQGSLGRGQNKLAESGLSLSCIVFTVFVLTVVRLQTTARCRDCSQT